MLFQSHVCVWFVVMLHFFPLDDSHTSSNEHFEDEDLEDKHLLSQSSVSEDAIVKEVHR